MTYSICGHLTGWPRSVVSEVVGCRWDESTLMTTGIALVAVTLVVLGRVLWASMQKRSFQRRLGGGIALCEDGRWLYSRFFKLPGGDLYLAPREGYIQEKIERDVPALAEAFDCPLAGITAAGWPMSWLGYRYRLYVDRTRRNVPDQFAERETDRLHRPTWADRVVGRLRNRHVRPSGKFVIGMTAAGTPAVCDLYSGSTGLVVGGNNSGKTTLITTFIRLVQRQRLAKVFLIDPHDLFAERDFGGVTFVRGVEAWHRHFAALLTLMHEREAILRAEGGGNWLDLPRGRIEPVLTVIDESHDLYDPARAAQGTKATTEERMLAEIQDWAGMLVRKGRKCGIYFVMAAQDPSQALWSIRHHNVTMFRVAFALATPQASSTFVGSDIAADPSLKAGRCVLQNGDGTAIVKVAQVAALPTCPPKGGVA